MPLLLIIALMPIFSSCHLIDNKAKSKFNTQPESMKVYDFCDPSRADMVWTRPEIESKLNSLVDNPPVYNTIMESYPRELEAGTITLLGYDQRPLDTVRVLRETPADGSRWGLENGDGVIRIHPTLLTVPLVDRDWGLRRSSP